MRFLIIIISFLIMYNFVQGQNIHPTGLLFDPELYKKVETISSALRFNDPYLERYSLKKYCPSPGNQNPFGSCTSWASGYAALSIAQAIINKNENTLQITKKAKSALYIYNQIKVSGCLDGAYIPDALKLLKEKGDCDLIDFKPNDCKVIPGPNEHQKASESKILEYNSLFESDANSDRKVAATINSLNSNKPVVIGMNLKPSFQIVGKNGKYNPSQTEKNFGRHALCVVGYDNINKEFEIINSWGTDWGNNGFFNISYDNYGKYCNEAYQFSLKPNNFTDNQLTGSFQLLKYSPSDGNSFININPFLSSDYFYYLNTKIQKDDYFRIKANGLVKDTYVYIFTIKPDNTSELLFPLNYNSDSQVKDIPLITSNSVSIELPENKENAYAADIIGEDVLVILYSKKRLENLDYFVKQSVNNKSDIWGWLKRYFKDDLIRQEDVEYSPYNMKVTSKKYMNGYVAALILKVKVK